MGMSTKSDLWSNYRLIYLKKIFLAVTKEYASVQAMIVTKVKFTTVVEGDPKSPFSTATRGKVLGNAIPFPGLIRAL